MTTNSSPYSFAIGLTARFFHELFDLPTDEALGGDLLMTSDTDIGVMALRSLRGEQTASLPSGTP